jgi:DNA-binding NarL/FixJ family response regulator
MKAGDDASNSAGVGQAHLPERQNVEYVVGKRTEVSPIKRLSDRELKVFQLIGRGRSTVQIAEELHLSPKTVEAHRAHVKRKLDLKTMTELVSFASRWVETQDAR